MRFVLIGVLVCAASGAEVPANARLMLRLQQPITSYGSERDTPVTAEIIAPVESNGKIIIPLGTAVEGTLIDVKRVGLGLSRETAYLHFEFTTLRFAGGDTVPIRSQVSEVDDAREIVDDKGRIRGIRATASFASVLSGLAVSAGAFDPMFLAFTFSSSLSAFRIPESEIVLPAGAEFRLKLLDPISLTKEFPPIAPAVTADPVAETALEDLVAKLPFRTATQGTNLPSDLTNLLFIGSRDAVQKAFDAAGWVTADERNAASTYATMRSIVENQGYQQAPMSTLLLGGVAPEFTFSKTLDTFFKRHHLRIFPQTAQFENQAVWTSSSTHDSGIGFATAGKTFIHVIDSNIDEERQKVVYDLVITGCVDGVSWVDRPHVPRDAKNATGDELRTDGAIAVLRMNDCANPKRSDTNVPAIDAREKGNAAQRTARNITLTLKNDLFRGNLFYQGYSGVRMALDARKVAKSKDPERTVKYAGQEFKIVRGAEAEKTPGIPRDRQRAPTFDPQGKRSFASRLEFSFSGGYSRFGNDEFSTQELDLYIPDDSIGTLRMFMDQELRPGFSVSPRVTVNSNRYLSHEFSFTHNDTPFRMYFRIDGLVDSTPIDAEAQIRQYAYNALIHLRPNGSRIRPYIAVGPGLQVIRLTEDTVDTRSKVRFAFRDVGLIISNYRLFKAPPLEGGAIIQPVLTYGAGVKVHVTPRFLVRADFRESLSSQPDFWSKSYQNIDINFGPDATEEYSYRIAPYVKHGPLRNQVFSFGIGVAF